MEGSICQVISFLSLVGVGHQGCGGPCVWSIVCVILHFADQLAWQRIQAMNFADHKSKWLSHTHELLSEQDLFGHDNEVSQIEDVDICVNVDVEFHPVGCSTPQTLGTICLCLWENKLHLFLLTKWMKQNKDGNIFCCWKLHNVVVWWIPQGEIPNQRLRVRVRLQFAKPRCYLRLNPAADVTVLLQLDSGTICWSQIFKVLHPKTSKFDSNK